MLKGSLKPQQERYNRLKTGLIDWMRLLKTKPSLATQSQINNSIPLSKEWINLKRDQ